MGKEAGKVVQFPVTRQNPGRERSRQITNVDGIKYFTDQQIKLLRRTVLYRAILDIDRGQVTAVREWMAIDLLTCTGLRVAEAANVRCGDIRAGYGECALFVRDGKGSKSRTVEVPDFLKKHMKQFVVWKACRGEPTGPDDQLFIVQRGPWTA